MSTSATAGPLPDPGWASCAGHNVAVMSVYRLGASDLALAQKC
jgi:hypothetical protein